MVATSYAEVVAVLGLRCSCRVWGAHAEIAVLRPRLRWLEHLNLSMSTSILAWAPQSWHEHRNLGMSTTILAWAPQSWHEHLNPSIGGRHRMLYFNIQRTEKYSIAMCYASRHVANSHVQLWSYKSGASNVGFSRTSGRQLCVWHICTLQVDRVNTLHQINVYSLHCSLQFYLCESAMPGQTRSCNNQYIW